MMTHYAPTTPEEEELAIALALSASLSCAGEAVCEPASSSASFSSQSSRSDGSTTSNERYQPSGPRPASDPLVLTLSLSLNPSLIYPQLPLPPAPGKPGPSAAARPPPSSTPSALLSQPPSRVQPHAPRHHGSASASPSRSRLPASGSVPVSPRATAAPAASDFHAAPSPLRPSRPLPQPTAQPSYLPPVGPPMGRSKSAAGPSGMQGGSRGTGRAAGAAASTSVGGGVPAAAAPAPAPAAAPQLFSDPSACAGCGKGFGIFSATWVTGMERKWHPACFKCGFCKEPISTGRGAFSYQLHPSDPLPYHQDCYRHVHHPTCHVCSSYIAPGAEGVISYRENGFWRERYCTTHADADLTRCCACSRLQKQGEEWAPLADGRPLCLQCLSNVVLDTPDAQPLYDDVLSWFRNEMRLPHPYKPPLLLVDGTTLNTHAQAEGRDDSVEAPVFHVRGLCVAHVYSHIPTILRGLGGGLRSVSTALGVSPASTVHCHVKVLLLLYGLPRLLSGSIMAHELMHAWLRMDGVVGLPLKVEEGLCQLMACLWLDRQHELLKGKPDEQRLASFFSYQIRTDTSDVYGDGFREAMEAFQTMGLANLIKAVKRYGYFTPR